MNSPNQKEKLGIRLIMKSLGILLMFVAVTFLTAGRLDYWQGWVFNGLNFLFIFLTYLFLIDRKDLIKERMKPGEGMKRWDKIYYMVSTPLFFGMFILSILDATRFSWQPPVPFSIMVLGIILYCIGQTIVLWAKRTNRFFSSVVRIQKDRTQTVCNTGPYRFVRHPGYLGGLIFTIGTPLMLGSFWGLIPAIITLLLMFGRTGLEDTTLKQELPGYKEYSTKVRYKIIPLLW
ncbi:MAG: isoprenylcysteine carboxylmethyltransferase family protein, partial [Candidatus Thermoplasmatota archaeon]|nr:isoprenylcysteine carboxylmethyltransferase family protein [Candidatus Thermoplasmatota archaeon]